MSAAHPVLIAGAWRAAASRGTFHGENPATGEALPDVFPISTWDDCDAALDAATEAADVLRRSPPESIARGDGDKDMAAVVEQFREGTAVR